MNARVPWPNDAALNAAKVLATPPIVNAIPMSKNRHGRFQGSKLFEDLFEQIVRQCAEAGLVQGKHLSVDSSFVEANAANESRIPREQLAEAAQVHHTVRRYLQEIEEQNPVEEPVEEPVHEQDQLSTTDLDSSNPLRRPMLCCN
jgi:hypothetical protein